VDPEQLAAYYAEMRRRQQMEQEFMAQQGAYAGQPGTPVPQAVPDPALAARLSGTAQPVSPGHLPTPPEPEPPALPAAPPRISQWDEIIRPHAGEYAEDPRFLRIVAAGARAESSDNPRAYQLGYDPDDPRTHAKYGGRGLWQFDINPGAMGHGVPEEQLFDPAYQASRIVPEYAKVYGKVNRDIERGTQRPMSDAELASLVAGEAERPYQWNIPSSPARRNYVRAYNELSQV
jgi:hypothetical protein